MCCVFCVVFFFVFFFQAEDGIRDAQESRGLGDVYKRQRKASDYIVYAFLFFAVGFATMIINYAVARKNIKLGSVSYTHLTLPTIYSV